ncbi:MAG TPA: SDR family oxidoreductase [Anaerolineales bacterium]|nr:SDR family oxidoreductase [Anaerolineales bacterium]
MKLENKIAIITGGSQGIGAGIAQRFAEEGAAVVIADINEEKSKELTSKLTASGHRAIFVVCDVSDSTQVDNLFSRTLEEFGRLDTLVNNAALTHHPESNKHFLELSTEAWLKALAINLTGMFFCSQRAGRIMVKQVAEGKATGGCIINIGSGGGSRAHRQLLAYDTTKGGIEAATRGMALDLAPWKIRVNTLVPGNVHVKNSLGGAIGPDAAQRTIPFGRPGSPDELGAAAAFIASDDALYMTGQRLIIDGGMDAQLRSPGVDTKIDLSLLERL